MAEAIWPNKALLVNQNEDAFFSLGYATPQNAPIPSLQAATPYNFSGATAYMSVYSSDDPGSQQILTLSSVPGLNTTTSLAQTLPTGTIYVASVAGFTTSGTIYVVTTTGTVPVAYTGVSGGNAFTGCTGGTGQTSIGGLVTQTLPSIYFSYGSVKGVQSGFINITIPNTITIGLPPGVWYYDLLVCQGILQDYYASGPFTVSGTVARV